MGMFKDMKSVMDITKAAQQMQAEAMKHQQAATQAADPSDPAFAPIEGITVDKYAEISAELMKKGVMGFENVNIFAESMGVKQGTWQAVQNGWVGRMGQRRSEPASGSCTANT